MSVFKSVKRTSIPAEFNADAVIARVREDIERLQRQRNAVLQEAGSELRDGTIAVYDEMLSKRYELLALMKAVITPSQVA